MSRRRLTPWEIEAIWNDPRRQWEIAEHHGICQKMVSKIKLEESHLRHNLRARFGPPGSTLQGKLSPSQAAELYLDPRTNRQIAAEYGFSSPSYVSAIKRGLTYKSLGLRKKFGPAPGTREFNNAL